ncbi:glycosyltransferase family 2 protein [Mariniflexile soesokkakense]|uniref:Glycosyltransferase family 2 protein n=1 Tax=Mariniflexile soesokkakense TaxID=1343160 RepID=A0ABV0A8C9_9FLAO
MKQKPRISILITHYNRPNDLLKCMNAIRQVNIKASEIVVSDDGSDQNTSNLLKTYSIDKLVLTKENKGLAANINKGIEACEGEYILYCQEDFLLNPRIGGILNECLELLDTNRVDLIRFTSNFKFNKLIKLTDAISLIPKFSFKNFTQNYYQYSDHPFITKKLFYRSYGYYLENTSGRYGETEYAIRICNSNAKIAITNETLATTIEGSQSILIHEFKPKTTKITPSKSLLKLARAFRLYFEWIFYNKTKRGLISYKNARKHAFN